MADPAILAQHLEALGAAYEVVVPQDLGWFGIQDFRLPPGYQAATTHLLIELPANYPLVPPGLGSARIYVPAELRYRGRSLQDVHSNRNGGYDGMAWLCFQSIAWNPLYDDLGTVLELIRTTLTHPPTH